MRYLPLTPDDRRAMLAKIGAPDIDALFRDVPQVGAWCRCRPSICPTRRASWKSSARCRKLAAKNIAAGAAPFFCGAGAYKHHVPSAVDHLIQRSEFLTSYTPYQPEIAQGTLQYLFEFQTQVALLTGMEVANASLYDGSTATAEAVLMAQRITRRGKAILSGGLHPHYAETVETVAGLSGQGRARAGHAGQAPKTSSPLIDDETACVVVQSPDVFGLIRNLRPIADAAHAKGALLIAVVTEVVSLGLLEPPGAQGADIVAAEGQSHRQRPEFRRTLCRPVRDPREIPAPDAGPAVRRDRGCRRPARLCADAFHPRAAYPPRKGDQQYLHQFRPLLPGLHHPSVAAGRGGADAAGAASITPRRRRWPTGWRRCTGVDAGDAGLLQRVHAQAAQARRAGGRCAGGEGHDRRRARLAPDAA